MTDQKPVSSVIELDVKQAEADRKEDLASEIKVVRVKTGMKAGQMDTPSARCN